MDVDIEEVASCWVGRVRHAKVSQAVGPVRKENKAGLFVCFFVCFVCLFVARKENRESITGSYYLTLAKKSIRNLASSL